MLVIIHQWGKEGSEERGIEELCKDGVLMGMNSKWAQVQHLK